jgi:anti-sigma factor RsiW
MSHLDPDTLLDHALGTLEADRAAVVDLHVGTCADCAAKVRAHAAEQGGLRAAFTNEPRAEASERRVTARVVDLVRADQAQLVARRRSTVRRLVLVAAVVLVAVGAAIAVPRYQAEQVREAKKQNLVDTVKKSEAYALGLEPEVAK